MPKVWNSTLSRHKPLKAKRASLKRNKRISSESFWVRNKPKPLPKVSKKRAKQVKTYLGVHRRFLALPENRYCLICLCRSLNASVAEVRPSTLLPVDEGDRLFQLSNAKLSPSTEVHHRRGRVGRLLSYSPEFIPSCRPCREWPHSLPKDARRLGLLAPPDEWNVFPEATS
jgi:hypothetical protein